MNASGADREDRRRRGLGAGWRGMMLGAALVALAMALRVAPRPVPGPRAPRDLVLVVVDTLRADHLPIYGYPRDTSPNLTRLARSAVKYSHAVSPGTWTVPAHGAMFTGLWPSFHGAQRLPGSDARAHPLRREAPTLAEILQARGFHTAAFVGNATFVTPSLGFARGFDEFHNQDLYDPRRLAEVLSRWLAARPGSDERLFLFVNILDPHEPYAPPPPLDTRFPRRHAELGPMMTKLVFAGEPVTPRMIEHFVSQYDGEIVWADAAVGEIRAALRRAGRWDDALVIVTSDHGEFLGEHGRAGHGQVPLEPQVHVPLVVRHPGGWRGGEVEERRVSTRAIFPSVLRAVNLALPAEVDPATLDEPHAVWVEDVASDGMIMVAGYAGKEKLLDWSAPDGRAGSELYDLHHDPGEDRATRDGSGSPGLRRAMAEFRAQPRPVNREIPPVIDPEREAQLRALGYVQ